MAKELHFKLQGRELHIVDPAVRFGKMNAMAFVQKVQSEQPTRVVIRFDGSTEAMFFLNELAGEVGGYFANIEGTEAVFEKV